MSQLVLGLVAALVWISVACAQLVDENSDDQKHQTLAGIVDVQSIILDKPIAFMHDGKSTEAQDVILIRIRVERIGEFLPRGADPPLFMYGNTVAQMLVTPLVDGMAVVLVPRPVSDETLPLWLAPAGTLAAQMTIEYSQQVLKQTESLTPNRVMNLRLPDVMEKKRIENVQSLRRFLLPKK